MTTSFLRELGRLATYRGGAITPVTVGSLIERSRDPHTGANHAAQRGRWIAQRESTLGGLEDEAAIIVPQDSVHDGRACDVERHKVIYFERAGSSFPDDKDFNSAHPRQPD